MNIDEILRLSWVVPLLKVNNLSRAQAVASNLVAGGTIQPNRCPMLAREWIYRETRALLSLLVVQLYWAESDAWGTIDHTSNAIAVASPPPIHKAAIPRFRPRALSALTNETTMRAPVAPTGWPSAHAPPLTLTLA